tara:strand:+ start:1183 stop:1863 length:681 start_codon:yes stop_codon:yes gene_type:complete
MNWQNKGYLLSINKYNENSSIANFYTENFGKVSGIIFGSTSKKNKSYLLIGNKLHLNFSSKNENSIGNFKVEIDKVNTPFYLNNHLKLQSIIYSMQIIDILTVENQENSKIFESMDNFFEIIKSDDWLKKFIFWELNLFKNLGYEINFKNYSYVTRTNGEKRFFIKNSNKEIPSFLVDDHNKNVNKIDLINAQNIISDFLNKSILNDDKINIPLSRQKFIDLMSSL